MDEISAKMAEVNEDAFLTEDVFLFTQTDEDVGGFEEPVVKEEDDTKKEVYLSDSNIELV